MVKDLLLDVKDFGGMFSTTRLVILFIGLASFGGVLLGAKLWYNHQLNESFKEGEASAYTAVELRVAAGVAEYKQKQKELEPEREEVEIVYRDTERVVYRADRQIQSELNDALLLIERLEGYINAPTPIDYGNAAGVPLPARSLQIHAEIDRLLGTRRGDRRPTGTSRGESKLDEAYRASQRAGSD